MSLIKKISDKLFGVTETEVEKLNKLKTKALQNQNSLQFKIAESIGTQKKLQQNLQKNRNRQEELQVKAKQFLLASDENGAKIALKKYSLIASEVKDLSHLSESEKLYLEQLKTLFTEIEVYISDMNSAMSIIKVRQKREIVQSQSSELLSEAINLAEMEKLTEAILIKSKRDEFMRALELDTERKLSESLTSVEIDEQIIFHIEALKKDLK